MTTTASDTSSTTDPCPSWCVSDHPEKEYHKSKTVDFLDTDGRRIQIDLGLDTGADKSTKVYIQDVDTPPGFGCSLEEFPISRVPALVEALQWALATEAGR